MELCIHGHARGWWQCLGINVHFGHVSFNPLGNDTMSVAKEYQIKLASLAQLVNSQKHAMHSW